MVCNPSTPSPLHNAAQGRRARYFESVRIIWGYQTPELRRSTAIVWGRVSWNQPEIGGFRAVSRLLPDLRQFAFPSGASLSSRTRRALSRSSPTSSPASRKSGASGAKYATDPHANRYMLAVRPPVASRSSSTLFTSLIASCVSTPTAFLASRQAWQSSLVYRRQYEQFLIASKPASTGTAYKFATESPT